ncbi:helix-turn-helix transcriptional regulator [Streptomyces sp. SL13]|uniref:Helix-turn-helix transcriptional regulator n=1 Tax=Streptantibioticus silvisoli TaxID=2705255 RepID=A0AA90H5L9_9ACTN|nr:helix-turn-helix transcriptional regulator [Streptantibioticus silvisoli]MDI5971408.1 helix-turn-helix transcriptional regulator [Streptantibioticus silvisoli]
MSGGIRRAKKPSSFVVDGNWPHAVMEPHRGALVAQVIARNLAEVITEQGISANALAQKSGVNRQVVTNVLRGSVWPDILTVVDLEGALGVLLWPDHTQWQIPEPRLPGTGGAQEGRCGPQP